MKRNKLLWLILWIASLTGISFFGGAVSYGAFFALTFLPVISYLYLILVYSQFKIYQETQSRDITCMEPMPYYFVLKNESFFGFSSIRIKMFSDFSFVENIQESQEYQLLPQEEFRYETKVTCKYRGEYPIGVEEIILTDFLRLFHLRYKLSETLSVIVHPRIMDLPSMNGLSQLIAFSPQSTSSPKSEPDVVVRDYVTGDSLKKIHWKLSAKEQALKVRPDIGEGRQNISVYLDKKRYSMEMAEYLPIESQLLEMLLSISLFFVKRTIPVNAYFQDTPFPPATITGLQDFEAFYTLLSALSFSPDSHMAARLKESLHSKAFANTRLLICLLPALDDDLLQITEQISSQECTVLIYLIGAHNPQTYQAQTSPRRQIISLPMDERWEVML